MLFWLAFWERIAFIAWRLGWVGLDNMAGKYPNLKRHIYTHGMGSSRSILPAHNVSVLITGSLWLPQSHPTTNPYPLFYPLGVISTWHFATWQILRLQ